MRPIGEYLQQVVNPLNLLHAPVNLSLLYFRLRGRCNPVAVLVALCCPAAGARLPADGAANEAVFRGHLLVADRRVRRHIFNLKFIPVGRSHCGVSVAPAQDAAGGWPQSQQS